MANVLYIPLSNGIRFYEASPALFDEYQTRFLNDYPFDQTLYKWQEPAKYAQKWQNSDSLPLQVQSNFEPLQIDLINMYGAIVTSFIGNKKIPNKWIAGMFAYEFTISWATVPEGCYHLRLTNGNVNELHMISEPISVKAYHPETVYIQYRNNRYHGDIIFETGITLHFRVEGNFDFLKPGSDVTAYEDQKANPYVLSAKPYSVWPLTIGGSKGVPDWVVHLFNIIWCHNNVMVDGKLFARSGEGEISFGTAEYYPMRGATIELREGINRGSKIVSPTLDPNKKLVVGYNIETNLFGDLSANASSNLVLINTVNN